MSVSSLYFPQVEKNTVAENVKIWSLDMKNLHYPEKEATLIFSFDGTLENKMAQNIDNFGSTLKNMTVENLDLIRNINEYAHEMPAGPKVS